MAPADTGRQPILNAPPGTVALCIVLVAVSAVLHLLGPEALNWTLGRFGLVPALFYLQAQPGAPGFSALAFLPLLTHIFLHVDWLHLAMNTAMLLAFGSLIERHVGTARFLMFFIACGIGGAIVQLLWVGPQMSVVLGASGGVYGAIGGAVPILYSGGVGRQFRRALIFIAVIMGLNLLFGILGLGLLSAGATIAWQDHIGGFFTGLALVPWLRRGRAASR